jgi:hypothetical protein
MKTALLLLAVLLARSGWSLDLKKFSGLSACKPLMDACMKAGKQGKEATTCVDSVKKGESVKDVQVKPEDLKACMASVKK